MNAMNLPPEYEAAFIEQVVQLIYGVRRSDAVLDAEIILEDILDAEYLSDE